MIDHLAILAPGLLGASVAKPHTTAPRHFTMKHIIAIILALALAATTNAAASPINHVLGEATNLSPTTIYSGGGSANALLIGKASLDSLANRFNAATSDYASTYLLSDTYDAYEGILNSWTSILRRYDNLKAPIYDGAKSATTGAQAGIGLSADFEGMLVILGAFIDYAQNDMDCPQSIGMTNATTKATGFGLHFGMRERTTALRLYWESIVRYAKESHDITPPGARTFGASGNSLAASLTMGCIVTKKPNWKESPNWNLEPQLRLAYQTHKIGNLTDPLGQRYDINRAESLETQATLRVWRKFEWRKNLYLTPHARAGAAHEALGKTKVHVAGDTIENNLSGLGAVLEAGAVMQFGRGVYAVASVVWYKTRKLESLALDATLGFRW